MNKILSSVTAIISGSSDVAILSHLISAIDYDTFKAAHANCKQPLTITREQFDDFIGRNGTAMMDAGLLNEEFVPTNTYIAQL